MMLTKMVVNTVANKLAKHFKLDKMMNYVFEDNELDEKTKNHEEILWYAKNVNRK